MKVTRKQILQWLTLPANEVAFWIECKKRLIPAPKNKPLELPCLIELLPSGYGKTQREKLRYVYRNKRTGELCLDDCNPCFGVRQKTVEQGQQEDDDENSAQDKAVAREYEERVDGVPRGWLRESRDIITADENLPVEKTPEQWILPCFWLPRIIAYLEELTRKYPRHRCTPELFNTWWTNYNRPLAEANMALIRQRPEALMDKKHGSVLVQSIMDLIEAADYGTCARRVPGVVPDGKRHTVQQAAVKALKILTCRPRKKGWTYYRNEQDFAGTLKYLVRRIWLLHQERRALLKENLSFNKVQETIRELHPKELEGFSKKELKSLLDGKARDAACRLAANKTGWDADIFRRALRNEVRIARRLY